jgi:hypothetical protein
LGHTLVGARSSGVIFIVIVIVIVIVVDVDLGHTLANGLARSEGRS